MGAVIPERMSKFRPSKVISTGIHAARCSHSKTISTGINSQTLLDIDRWQFGWQQTYYLQQPVRATASDLLTLECHWDNSYANQPTVDGKKGMPRDVVWGEGSGDEMCVSLLGVALPRL